MSVLTGKPAWLKNENEETILPKTLASCVCDASGEPISDKFQNKLTYSGNTAGTASIAQGGVIMSASVPSNGAYLVLAYSAGSSMWANNITDTANSGYWKLSGGAGGAKIYESLKAGTFFAFYNLNGSAAAYPGSFIYLIKLA